ncbi:polyketide cyclase [Fusarium heterosporum]|uniref:Polyketide cyclase n=1 Tax=Fusarium heterosporum TaxID=42747 RepID=A0A8H5WP71_FUSHE|nr:polyketide cyclase [Fusarium heterosporum]
MHDCRVAGLGNLTQAFNKLAPQYSLNVMDLPWSRADLVAAVEKILDKQNEGHQTDAESLVQPNITVDGRVAPSVETWALDSCVIDVNAQAVAVRVIKTQAISLTRTCQYQEIIFAWFAHGQLSCLKTLRDNDARRAEQELEKATPQNLQAPCHTSLDLEAKYRAYIKSINDQTMEATFDGFCKAWVSHNAAKKTIAEYISLIQESQSAIQGLNFEIQDLIIDKDAGRVAARLEFTGTPVKRWADAMPTGGSVKFHEHVMYWFDEGKIHWVWSIVDLDTYREQLQS